jgi:pyruvate formate lyase activating enzyme
MTVGEVMNEIRKDTLFYFYSGGGVTLSGGDLLLQADFSREILMACREDCINTAAELDMYGPYENVTKVLEHLNSYFVDIKLMDCEQHRRWTGVENTSILENTLRAANDFPRTTMVVRVPLIPGINDSRENIGATAEFCKRLKSCKTLEFLPFHRLGTIAYRHIGRPYSFAELPPMAIETARQRIGFLTDQGQKLPFKIRISDISF